MQKKEHIISMLTTFATDFAYEILMSVAILVKTGNITFAAISAVGYTAFRHSIKIVVKKFTSE